MDMNCYHTLMPLLTKYIITAVLNANIHIFMIQVVQENARLALKDALIVRVELQMLALDVYLAMIYLPMGHAWNTIIPKINWNA